MADKVKHGTDFGQLLGLMADSHGCAAAITAGIELLNQYQCDTIVHLGDIVDSCRPETAAECVEILLRAGVSAVKGNNDHALAKTQGEINTTKVDEPVLDYLRSLPLKLNWGNLILTHSLPFDHVLGDSCMIRPLGKPEVERFFQEYPDRILFRGHSHKPELCAEINGKPASRYLDAGDIIGLAASIPCLITCGALTNGFCMTFDTLEQRIAILSLSTCQGV